MITYQDLLEVGENEQARMDFIRAAIARHKQSEEYKTAVVADLYLRHRNVTITDFKKLLYTVSGRAVPDNWNANYKMASRFFYRFVIQEVQHLLGNGTSWDNDETGERLGTPDCEWDTQLQKAAKVALTQGVCFGFFDADRLRVFPLTEFVPLYDEEDGALKAGVRFWQIDDDKPLRATLYELDGFTDYMWRYGDGELVREKKPYIVKADSSPAEGVIFAEAQNYPGFPIVPLWGNPEHQSELVGIREQIDCYDLIKSGFANTVDEASMVYWTITNAGGMDDRDLAKFVQRMMTVHAYAFEGEEQATSHAQEVPYASREALLDRLSADLYRDAMALDTEHISSGATTATQILAAYEPLESKCDSFEYCVIEFVKGILKLAGIDDSPTFTRSVLINRSEEIQSLMQAAQYLPEDYITEKVLTLFGDGDRLEDVMKTLSDTDVDRMTGGGEVTELPFGEPEPVAVELPEV